MLRAVFVQLRKAGGRARGTEVLAAAAPTLNLTEHEKQLVKSGAVRWETVVRWYTVDCGKAGYLLKKDGYWLLTPLGEQALALPPGQLIRHAKQAYRDARARIPETAAPASGSTDEAPAADLEVDESAAVLDSTVTLDQARENARTEIEAHLSRMTAYDFQDLVAELLKGMGYHIPFVASPGPDGGIDIVAYLDPLGTSSPRIKVQVKHREAKAGAKEVRELEGLLRKDGDIGLFVSSAGFSADALREIRSSSKHIETMDQDRLISLWQDHYESVSQEGKALLPLVRVHFLAPLDE